MKSFFGSFFTTIILVAVLSCRVSGQRHTLYCIADVSSAGMFSSKMLVEMDYGKDSLVKQEVLKCMPDIKARIFISAAAVIQSFSDCGWVLVSSYVPYRAYHPKLVFKKEE